MENEKTKLTEKQFSEVLYAWLANFMTETSIRKIAQEIHFEIRNTEDLGKIYNEFLALNIWLIIYTCDSVIENKEKRNKYLDLLHKLVYERHIKENKTWLQSMAKKYLEYTKAIETEHPSTPLWVLATLIYKNLFGEIKKDPFLQMYIVNHVGLFIDHLSRAIKEYEIE